VAVDQDVADAAVLEQRFERGRGPVISSRNLGDEVVELPAGFKNASPLDQDVLRDQLPGCAPDLIVGQLLGNGKG